MLSSIWIHAVHSPFLVKALTLHFYPSKMIAHFHCMQNMHYTSVSPIGGHGPSGRQMGLLKFCARTFGKKWESLRRALSYEKLIHLN